MAEARPLSGQEVQVLEANAVAHGVSIDQLMDNAGHAVAEEARRHLPPPPAPVGIVCGLGNNGGDGLASASVLSALGYQPRLWLLADPSQIRSAAALRRWEMVRGLRYVRVGVPAAEELRGLPLIIDAMLGTGGTGEPREPYRSAVREITDSAVKVLSVDLPTGLGSPSALRADWTVALEVRKEGMDHPSCGAVEVRSIGMPEEAHRETGVGEFLLYPVPPPTTQKSDSGRVVVIGGGPYYGAPYLAGMGALRGGADMVFVLVPGSILDTVQGYSAQLIVRGVGTGRLFTVGDRDAVLSQIERIRPTAVLLGNGIGEAPTTLQFLEEVLEHMLPSTPCVVDADGLRLVSRRGEVPLPGQSPSRWLLTPNLREFAHLDGRSANPLTKPPTPEEVRRLAARLRATLLVKGPEDILSDGESTKLNRTHHPAMVAGGAGDVLAGLLTSLLARGLTPYQAGRLGSFWLGRTSLAAFEEVSYALLPEDLLARMGPALRRGLDEVRRLTDPGRPAPTGHA